MNIEKMREEFQKFRDARNAMLESEGHKPGSKWHVTNAHYPTWQASRESLVIELPPGGYFAGYDNEHMMESRDVRESIEAAGLKVKS